MLRAFKNLPKVLRGKASQVPCGPTNSASVSQVPPALCDSTPSSEISIRQPGHIRLFSWLPACGHFSFQECFHYVWDRGQRGFHQRQQWQSNRQNHTEFEAIGWGTAVMVAIQLCRVLSVARFPDNESNLRPTIFRPAKLLPVPPTARGVLGSQSSSENSDSVSYASTDEDSLAASLPSSPSIRYEASSESWASSTGEADSHQSEGASNTTKDTVIQALESAMSQLDRAHSITQGVVHTMMGVQYASIGRYAKAVEHFEAASQMGYSKAQFNLGLCFELGRGVQTDKLQAAYLYQQAAEQGHPLALYNLGVFCYLGDGGIPQDEAEAVRYMEKAAAAGVIQAHSFLGNHYLHAASRDIHKAVYHLKRAVAEEDTESEYLLGLCYEQGWGVHKSRRKAAVLYHKAAEKGYPLAMYSLGLYYEKQIGGLIQDKEHAMRLYAKASEGGLQLATERLKSLTSTQSHEEPQQSNELRDATKSNANDPTETESIRTDNVFHTSASEPCLHDKGPEKRPVKGTQLRLSYLSLILPSLLRATDSGQALVNNDDMQAGGSMGCQDEVLFQVGEEEVPYNNNWRADSMESLQLVM